MLAGRVCLVTGSTGGIGRGICDRLAKLGASVVCAGRDLDRCKNVQLDLVADAAISSQPQRHYAVAIDMGTTSDFMIAALSEVEAEVGRPMDTLINVAGLTIDSLLIRLDDERMSRVLDVNLAGTMRLTRAISRSMLKRRQGCILSIGSVLGDRGGAGQAAYAASKAGLVGFTKSLAQELGPKGIRVNCLAPGYIDTQMTKDFKEDYKEKLIERTALRRFGEPCDVANVAAFLVSDYSAFVTGQCITVDGGLS